MEDGDVLRMSEAADITESAAARVARKQTNKGRARRPACYVTQVLSSCFFKPWTLQ